MSESEKTSTTKEGTLDGAPKWMHWVQWLTTTVTALVALYNAFFQNWQLFAVFLGVGATFFAAFEFYSRSRPKRPALRSASKTAGVFLRGLRPFEKDDILLGRAREVQLLVTMIGSTDFRIGCMSGELGTGKTSLLRAGLIRALETQGYKVFYLERPGSDVLELPERWTSPQTSEDSLSLFQKTGAGKKPVLVIIDQFEEFFIVVSRRETQIDFFNKLADFLKKYESLHVLLCLRKEYLLDLMKSSQALPDLMISSNVFELRHWDAKTARAVLKESCEQDNVGFSDRLIENIIVDLERNDRVIPIELQIVATQLADLSILDLNQYEAKGRANGILANFINQIIAPLGEKTPEPDRVIVMHALRVLCPDQGDSRRPEGLSLNEVLDRVIAKLDCTHYGRDFTNRSTAKQIISDGFTRAEKEKIVIFDGNKYNLAHDYVVPIVREASPDVTTIAHNADSLLRRYLSVGQISKTTTIPIRDLFFICRFASPDLLRMRESKTLVARTYTAASLVILGLLSLIIITLYFATPPAEKYDRTVLKSWPDPISWMCSSDKTKLLGYQQNDQSGRPENLIIWDLTTNSAEPQKIPLPDTPVAISPAGDYIATVKNNDLFLRPIRSNMSSRKYEHCSPSNFGFTPDGRFVFAISTDGKLRIWKPGENFDQKKDFTVANQKSVTVQASPLGRWLTVYDGVKLVRLVSCDNPSVAYALQGLQLWYNGSLPLHFTHHEDFVAYSTNDANVRVLDMSTGENNCLMRPAIQSSPGMPPLSSPQITFTPDDQTLLILFGNSSHSLYRWENDGTHKNTCVPMDDIPYYGPVPYTNDLAISPDSQLVAGNASRELCIWPLKQKSRLVGCKRLKCWSPLPPVFTRDGQRMAIVSTGGYFYVWNLNESFDADKYLDIMEQTCRPVTFSIDGTEILFTNNTQVFIYKILTNTYLDCLLQQPATDLVQILASSSQKHSTLLFTSYNVFSLQRVTAFLNITLAPANSPQFQSPFDLCPDIPSAVPTCVGPPIPPPEFVSGPKKLLPSKKARKQHQS